MYRYFLILILALTSLTLLAEEDPRPMVKAYENFKDIQKIIHNNDKSSLTEAERIKLYELVTSLRGSLHNFQDYPNQASLPAFKDNLEQLLSTLDQVQANLKTPGSSDDWSLWRLKTISTSCQTCHANFHVDISFKDSDIPQNFNSFEKAEFLLASRQYVDAKKYYWEFITQADYQKYGFNYAFNRWIDLIVRVMHNPELGIKKLNNFIKKNPKISKYELQDLHAWIKSLEDWKNVGGQISLVFSENKALISDLLLSNQPIYEKINLIKLLRAAAGFHKMYERGQMTPEENRKSLFYLGLIYARTPMFFIYELPEMYLKLCIKQYPGSDEAKDAFELLKELVTNGFTGSGGTHLDPTIKIELDQLMGLAYQE